MPYAVYILECSDGSYYTGLTRDLDARIEEHQSGAYPEAYTFPRRPVRLVWSVVTEKYSEALAWEQKIKGWSRAKKRALILYGFEGVHKVVEAQHKGRSSR
jgi:predicted GIY-YIG superfamily endonuclease